MSRRHGRRLAPVVPAGQRRLQSLWRWYPVLFAAFPILALAAGNPGEYTLSDLLTVLAVMVGGAVIVQLALVLALRRRWPENVPPALALLFIIGFFAFVPFSDLLERIGYTWTRPRTLAALLIGVAVLWLLLARPVLRRFSTFATLMGALLVAQSVLGIIAGQVRGGRMIRRSRLVADLARPIPVRARSQPCPAPKPDIYFLILDGYPNAAVLRKVYQFSNARFQDSLQALGFRIPRLVRSNYAHTHLSLASFLNLDYLTSLRSELGAQATDPSILGHLIENNRAVRFLRAQGYNFVFSPSSWWPATMGNRNADVQLKPWSGIDLARELGRTDLRRVVRDETLLGVLAKPELHRPTDGEYILRSFDAMKGVPAMPHPTVLIAHVLAPHYPYVLDANCEPHLPGTAHTDPHPWANRQAYLDQLLCVNQRVLDLVDTVLRNSSSPPIIILQGDHGSNTRDQANRRSAMEVTPDEAAERFGAFGAYFMPCGQDSAFAGEITPVNVLRKVFRLYLGADLPTLPDSFYFSVTKHPFDLVRFAQSDTSLSGPSPLY